MLLSGIGGHYLLCLQEALCGSIVAPLGSIDSRLVIEQLGMPARQRARVIRLGADGGIDCLRFVKSLLGRVQTLHVIIDDAEVGVARGGPEVVSAQEPGI